jgi:site-specific recombinase XerD
MSDNLPALPGTGLAESRRATAEFLKAAKAEATRRAYAADWRDFKFWAASNELDALPATPENVAVYLASLAKSGRRLSTIRRRCAAIAHMHQQAGHDNPAAHTGVRATLSGIARSLGSAPTKKAALTSQTLERVIRKIPTVISGLNYANSIQGPDLPGLRDRALILIGFAGALRRSELVALDVADVARHPKGIVLTIRKSKTDQAGVGKTKAVPHGKRMKPVEALDAWLAASKITSGPLFRGVCGLKVQPDRLCTTQVARIIKARVRAAGLDPRVFSGHSLRSGFITSAADAGASLQSIADHAGHEKLDTTLGYVQVADAFRDHSGKKFL